MHVWDAAGRRYLDCFGGVLTISVGHCNPEVTEAIVQQVKTLVHTSTLFPHPPLSDLAEALAGVLPGDPIAPPLIAKRAEIDELIAAIDDAFADAASATWVI